MTSKTIGNATEKLSQAAVANIRSWLTDAKYAEFAGDVARHLKEEKFAELNKAFWKVLEFGTGGRRGEMYPIGTAVINRRTMGESAAGLAAALDVPPLGFHGGILSSVPEKSSTEQTAKRIG